MRGWMSWERVSGKNRRRDSKVGRSTRFQLEGLEDRRVLSVSIVGGLSNFDCTNNTGGVEDEFEIELPSVDPKEIASFWANTPAYKGSGYGTPTAGYGPSSDGVAGHMSTYVDYKATGVSTRAGFTEHFGVHFVNPSFLPATTIYTWKNNGVAANVPMPSVSLTSTANAAGGFTVRPVVINNTTVPLVVQFHTSRITPANPEGVQLSDLVDTNVEVQATEAEPESGDNGRTGVTLNPGQVLGIDGEAHDATDPIIVDPQAWLRAHPGEAVDFAQELNAPGESEMTTLVVSDTAGHPISSIFSAVNTATAPVLTLPANQTVEAKSASGSTDPAAFTASATSSAAGTPTIVYSVGGSTIQNTFVFPLGTTTVNVTATIAGLSSSGSFNVTVHDTTPPALTLPANQTVEAVSSAGAVDPAAFTAKAVDAVTANPAIVYSVAGSPITSSYVFPLGVTTVDVKATDGAGNTSTNSFTVKVRDTTPPVLSLPANQTVSPTDSKGALDPRAFTAKATDAVTSQPTIVYSVGGNPISPSYEFPLGVTKVKVTATDQAGNSSTGTFSVTVAGPIVSLSRLPAGPFVGEANIHLVASATEAGYSRFKFDWSVTWTSHGVSETRHFTWRNLPKSALNFEANRPGVYTISVVATDARGIAGSPQSVSFTLLNWKGH